MIGTEFQYKVGKTVRTYRVIEMKESFHLKQDLQSRGFDGNSYIAISEPTGKQKKTYYGLFYRTPEGQFV